MNDLSTIVDQTLGEIARAADLNALEQIRVRLLGKSGVKIGRASCRERVSHTV